MTSGNEWRARVALAISSAIEPGSPIYAGSYARATRVRSVRDADFDLVISDECHRTQAGYLLGQVKRYDRAARRADAEHALLKLLVIARRTADEPMPLPVDVDGAEFLWKQEEENFILLDFLGGMPVDSREELWRRAAAAEQRAQQHREHARAVYVALLRELGITHIEVEADPPILETSPCGVSRFRAPVIPRPPTTVEYHCISVFVTVVRTVLNCVLAA
ncbi:hypothetical protein ACLIYP_01195 [Streptomyces nanhaiensis]|uniref:hypothetical protein n=1 Tax=Streptomyces nanhaiensis TaxID=679319 RepID=UPI00399C5AEA